MSKHNNIEEFEIVVCDECEGWGYLDQQEDAGCHNSEYIYWTEKCKKCKGSGRLGKIVKTTIVAHVPRKVKFTKRPEQ